ncbi:hypothetical protein Dda_5740 [Drechslerella dactyloides]|uniref:Uncharacterized protein n=1 Tax=Drechslerella dactyloides TaxID=74499 RepID=A0AAD6IUE9_DREDA|nr:hypothetical protein Dda_5740 [Drechslerella dactyloides]
MIVLECPLSPQHTPLPPRTGHLQRISEVVAQRMARINLVAEELAVYAATHEVGPYDRLFERIWLQQERAKLERDLVDMALETRREYLRLELEMLLEQSE